MTKLPLPPDVRLQNVLCVVHGGAGTIQRQHLTPDREAACHASLADALYAAHAAYQAGKSALDLVEAAVRVLEDNPLFNAGRGAVFTHDGTIELDASVMDGETGGAGAITGVVGVRNPVALARAVMEQSPFVFLSGRGAEDFARTVGTPFVPPDYFHTEERRAQLQTQLRREENSGGVVAVSLSEDNKFGTVGAVARDARGHLAAATSTGGMTGKRWGRIGDSPVVGAGTWASDATCAVSATGHGEYFLRVAAAHSIAARMEWGGQDVAEAAQTVVLETLRKSGGQGGVIALDGLGNAALPFNTPGMYRGVLLADGTIATAIFAE